MKNKSIIALGHNENVYVFNAIGIDGIVIQRDMFIKSVNDYIKEGIKIFFVSQEFNDLIREIKEENDTEAYPIFLSLSMDKNVESIGIEEIRKNVEKATGINLI